MPDLELKTLIRSQQMWKIKPFFLTRNLFDSSNFYIHLYKELCASHFRIEPANENEQFKETKTWISYSYLIRHYQLGMTNQFKLYLKSVLISSSYAIFLCVTVL